MMNYLIKFRMWLIKCIAGKSISVLVAKDIAIVGGGTILLAPGRIVGITTVEGEDDLETYANENPGEWAIVNYKESAANTLI